MIFDFALDPLKPMGAGLSFPKGSWPKARANLLSFPFVCKPAKFKKIHAQKGRPLIRKQAWLSGLGWLGDGWQVATTADMHRPAQPRRGGGPGHLASSPE